MSYKRAIEQLRPVRIPKENVQEKTQSYLTEAFTVPITTLKDAKKYKLEKLFNYLKKKNYDEIPLVVDPSNGQYKIRGKEAQRFKVDINTIIQKNNIKVKPKYGQGSPTKEKGAKTANPSGADWENIICHQYNKLLGNENFDPNAKDGAKKFYPTYKKAGEEIAKSFAKKIGKTGMIQFGAGKSSKNLTSFWLSKGGTDGTPKTDMYTKTHNISLKKAGGSQLASGAKGETLAMFAAALEYLGSGKSGVTEIKRIQKEIEDNFTKLSTDYTKGQLDKMSKESKKNLKSADKKLLSQYITTENFHKELNEKLKKHLDFSKNPEFMQYFIYEAMSGSKKFSIQKAKASVCMEFDANSGAITKFVPVTVDGKNKFGDFPKISSELKSIASKVKVYAAWKSSSGNPYSSLRVSSVLHKEEETLQSIIKEIVRKDIIANAVLKEEIEQIDEFAAIGRVFDKLKEVGKNAINWIKNLVTKILNAVKNALNKIAQMGSKMFEGLFKFIGIEIQTVRTSFPADLNGFIFGTKD
tara:strand:+ start:38 stop:1612 length:1575 start_codon:yes stop_codon:yes gene_type:complete